MMSYCAYFVNCFTSEEKSLGQAYLLYVPWGQAQKARVYILQDPGHTRVTTNGQKEEDLVAREIELLV